MCVMLEMQKEKLTVQKSCIIEKDGPLGSSYLHFPGKYPEIK